MDRRLRLYLVTDERLCPHPRLLELLPELVRAGVTMVQLRDKTGSTAEMVERARALVRVLRPLGVPVLVNDRTDVAFAAGADGVHLGASDLDARSARHILGPNAIIGVSAERTDALPADGTVANYLAVSPVFSTPTKVDTAPPLGLDGIRALRDRAGPLPIVGIGGMDLERAPLAIEAGADGVAVVSAVLGAEDPVRAAETLGAAVAGALGARSAGRSGVPQALTVAGSDSGGGAGIQADLKTFSARGVYGASVLTALTAQNTRGVSGIHGVPPSFVLDQMRAVFSDLDPGATKIGMLGTADVIEVVKEGLLEHRARNVVVDPVMVAKSGDRLLEASAVEALRRDLLPLADVLTPNLPEVADLLGVEEPRTAPEMRAAAEALRALGPRYVLVKGGHGPQLDASTDVLVGGREPIWLESPRTRTSNTHGTGCTLSAAVAAELAKGGSVETAVHAAKAYLSRAIAHADRLGVGSGHGPVHHFHALWETVP